MRGPGAVLMAILVFAILIAALAIEAQPLARSSRIGFLGAASLWGYASQVEAFRQGLRALAYVEGQNITIEYRWAEGKYDRLFDLATELVKLNVDVILTHGTPGTEAAKRATRTIPIVVVVAGDAVATGLVKSLARPGGNVTGSSYFLPELSAKRLELLREVLPKASHLGVLVNPANLVHELVRRELDPRARALRVELQYVAVRGPSDLDSAFDALAAGRNQGLVVLDDGMLITNAGRIADGAVRRRMPVIGFGELAAAGALMSYGVSFPELWRQAPTFVDKILKGARPANLPIEQASRFEFRLNLRTARALGLTIPSAMLTRADEVIE